MTNLDPLTQQIVNDFDTQAKKRAAEVMLLTLNEPSQAMRERAFCLGYKAGVIDLSASFREQPVVDVARMAAVFEAACRWRDAWPAAFPQELIEAVDTARKTRP